MGTTRNSNELNDREISLLRKFGFSSNFENCTDDELLKIEDCILHEMQTKGIADNGDELNEYGLLCDNILGKLPND